jgi:hypothetical protein
MKMDWIEAEDLARVVLDLDENADHDAVEQEMANRYEISMEGFQAIAGALLELVPPVKSALTGNEYRGFVKDDFFIVKKRAA